MEVHRPISYYDSVKDSVEEKDDTADPNFSKLREAAEENTEPEDQREGDDTEIEVLEDGLSERKRRSGSRQEKQQTESRSQETQPGSGGNPLREAADSGSSEIEQKLDRLIEQNERIIEILESFGQ